VLRHESKCATLHGHRYVAMITCEADALDSLGRVVDFGTVKAEVGTWVDTHWDHSTLINKEDADLISFCQRSATGTNQKPGYTFDGEPTAENIAAVLFEKSSELLGTDNGLRVTKVVVYETPNCSATCTA
jgi:6-pyruvoyltetrahydropterin/6-carboxytetrahydropterin synthase